MCVLHFVVVMVVYKVESFKRQITARKKIACFLKLSWAMEFDFYSEERTYLRNLFFKWTRLHAIFISKCGMDTSSGLWSETAVWDLTLGFVYHSCCWIRDCGLGKPGLGTWWPILPSQCFLLLVPAHNQLSWEHFSNPHAELLCMNWISMWSPIRKSIEFMLKVKIHTARYSLCNE